MDSDDEPLMAKRDRIMAAATANNSMVDFSDTEDKLSDAEIFANPKLAFNENLLQVVSKFTYNELLQKFNQGSNKPLKIKSIYGRVYHALRYVAADKGMQYDDLHVMLNQARRVNDVGRRTNDQRTEAQNATRQANREGKKNPAEADDGETEEADDEHVEDDDAGDNDDDDDSEDALTDVDELELRLEVAEDPFAEEAAEDAKTAGDIFQTDSSLGFHNPIFGDVFGKGKKGPTRDQWDDMLRTAAQYKPAAIVEGVKRDQPDLKIDYQRVNALTSKALSRVAEGKGITRATLKNAYEMAKKRNGVTRRPVLPFEAKQYIGGAKKDLSKEPVAKSKAEKGDASEVDDEIQVAMKEDIKKGDHIEPGEALKHYDGGDGDDDDADDTDDTDDTESIGSAPDLENLSEAEIRVVDRLLSLVEDA